MRYSEKSLHKICSLCEYVYTYVYPQVLLNKKQKFLHT